MAVSEGVFTATMSYHTMLKRAQECSPVLAYVVCRLLFDIDLEKEKHAFVCSEYVRVHPDNQRFSAYFHSAADMKGFIGMIFFGITVRLSDGIQRCGENGSFAQLVAQRQFVIWLKKLDRLEFKDESMEVVIPA